MEVMNATQFETFASRVEANCNVKFRYSLLAGTPPFEWIAGKKTAVTSSEIMDWFSAKLSLAAKDVTKKSAKAEALQQYPARKNFVHCIQDHLGADVRVWMTSAVCIVFFGVRFFVLGSV